MPSRRWVLGLIGALHLVFVWFGDILTTYAIVGVVLLAFVGRSPVTMLRWAVGSLGTPGTAATVAIVLLGVRAASGSSALVDAERSFGGFFTVLAGQVLLMAVAAPVLTVDIAAGVVLVLDRRPAVLLVSAGRLALTNYLVQSLVFSAVFYSYGLGLFGRVGAATGVAMAVTLYAGQLVVSRWWLARLGEGPVERVWRRLTYGRRQAQVDRSGNPSTPSAPVFTAST